MKLYKNVIAILFFALAVYIFVLNLVCTCFTSADRFEMNYYSGDNIILNILAVILMVIAAALLGRTKLKNFLDNHHRLLVIIFLSLIAVTSMIFAISCNLGASVDQLYIQRCADELRRGIFDCCKPTQYIDMHPHQGGLVIITYLLSFIFGTYHYLAFRIINVAFLVLLYSELMLIGRQLGIGKAGEVLILVMGLFFLPTTLYVLFVYGNLGGAALSVLAVRLMVDAFARKKTLYGILSCLAIFAACVFKSNYLIFAIGLGIYCFFKALSVKEFRKMIFVPALVLVIWLSSFLPLTVLRSMTGFPLDGGESMLSYLVMGVQENSPNYAGGFNGFNEDTYKQLGGDKNAHTELSIKVYEETLSEMSSDPAYVLNFFTRKQLHQWADPVYKAYWSNQAVPQNDTAEWFYRFIRPDFEYPVVIIFSYFQIFVWAGAIFYIWFSRDQKEYAEALIMPLMFIGGFIFHTFWEAKSQYVFQFFVILFPVCLIGWSKVCKRLASFDISSIKGKLADLSGKKLTWSYNYTLVSVAVIFVFGEILGVATLSSQFVQDKELYRAYVDHGYRESWNPLDDGEYVLTSGSTEIKCEIVNKGDKTLIKEAGGDRYLTGSITGEEKGSLIWEQRDGNSQVFKFYSDSEGEVVIVYDNDYVFGGSEDGIRVKYAPYGTLIVSELEEGLKWKYKRV